MTRPTSIAAAATTRIASQPDSRTDGGAAGAWGARVAGVRAVTVSGVAAQCGGRTTSCSRSHLARRVGEETIAQASLIRDIVGEGGAPASG